MTRLAGTFLVGATGRLLPMSIPFRYFAAAVVFHLLAWLALLAGADGFPRFSGGLGWPLAALHLVTLGVLTMTAIGASLQLLPVATRQAARSTRLPAAIWWLYAPGVAVLACGMGAGLPLAMAAGSAAVAGALLVWAALLGANLRGARGMPGVVLHGWASLGALLVMLAAALALVALYFGVLLLDRSTALALHIAFAAYGFMGLLAFGLSYILVPMFALFVAPDERQTVVSGGLVVAALAAAALAAVGVAPPVLRVVALVVGSGAVALHLRLMHRALRGGMRRELGRSFTLVRVGWAALPASLAAALAVALDVPLAGVRTLFGLLLIGGWLLSFLLGMLQRILPFLASMHTARGGNRPPTPSALTAARPLAVHFHCHLVALVLLLLAVLVDSTALATLGAVVGAAGASGYAAFFVVLWRRTRGHAAPAQAPIPPTA